MSDGFIINICGFKHSAGARRAVDAEGTVTQPDFSADVRVSGTAENLGGGVFAFEGLIAGNITVCCARCLEPVTMPYEAELLFRFVNRDNADDEALLVSGDNVDFASVVAGTVRADISYAVLCKDDCAGLCQICGNNLNESVCGCEKELINPVIKTTDLFIE